MEENRKILLAYSGGLDTSCILKWLLEKGYDVTCFMADVGQGEDFTEAKQKAIKIGATEVVVMDLTNDFVENYIWPSIQMGLIYETRYLLGTSLARPCITVGLIETAKEHGIQYISHGATGKGNDQVRFELNAYALYPDVKMIVPWRITEFCERFQGRADLLEYAKENSIPVSATPKSPWSMDANIMHIRFVIFDYFFFNYLNFIIFIITKSYESGILEDPSHIAPEEIYQMTKKPKTFMNPIKIEVTFKNGLPVKITDLSSKKNFSKPLEILNYLNIVGGEYGVGRIDIVENRFIGLKSRGVYETPGGTILYTAHNDLEIFCLDREVYRVTKTLRDKMADYVYNGLWFSPEADFVGKCLKESQNNVNGKVIVEVFAGNGLFLLHLKKKTFLIFFFLIVWAISRQSDNSLYNQELVSMDAHGSFTPSSASGFIEINAVRIKEHYRAYGGITKK